MRHLHFAAKLNSMLSNLNKKLVMDHYKRCYLIIEGVDKNTSMISITACDLKKFSEFLADDECIQSMISPFKDETQLFYFECKTIFSPIEDLDIAIVILQANSEEELVKVFDPKLMMLA